MTQATSSPAIVTIEPESLDLGDDGRFVFPGHDQYDPRLSADDVFLVLGSAQSPSQRTICFLKEEDSTDTAKNPWTLILLRTSEAVVIPEAVSARHPPLDQVPSHLVPVEGKRRVDVVVSTKSGTGRALIFWQTVLQPLLGIVFEELGGASSSSTLAAQLNVLVTESADSVSDFARSLEQGEDSKEEERTIVLLSGDGGVVDLINAVAPPTDSSSPPTTTTIALLPLGTGNALFHSMHKPAYAQQPTLPALAWSLRTLLQEQQTDQSPPQLPAFEVSFPADSHLVIPGSDTPGRSVSSLRGVVVASYGFHASIVYESDTPEHRVHGAKRFGMVAEELLRTSHPYDARVTLTIPEEGTKTKTVVIPRDTHAYVLTTLVSNLEQSFTISPASTPLDGKLRIVHFGPVGGERTMDAMKAAYDGGRHVDLAWDDGERVGYQEVEAIEIEIRDEESRWRKVCVDGTIVDVPRGAKVTVRRIPESPFRILISKEALN